MLICVIQPGCEFAISELLTSPSVLLIHAHQNSIINVSVKSLCLSTATWGREWSAEEVTFHACWTSALPPRKEPLVFIIRETG